MKQHRGNRANHFILKGLFSFPLSGYQISGLLVHDFDLLVDPLAGRSHGITIFRYAPGFIALISENHGGRLHGYGEDHSSKVPKWQCSTRGDFAGSECSDRR